MKRRSLGISVLAFLVLLGCRDRGTHHAPQPPEQEDTPSPGIPSAPLPKLASSRSPESPRERLLSPSPSPSPSPKARFEIFQLLPDSSWVQPQVQAPEGPTAASSGSPKEDPKETEEEVVIIPAVPTPQIIEFPGSGSPRKE